MDTGLNIWHLAFMTFAIYGLLGEGAPAITVESLASDLENFFRNQENFSIEFEQLPFAKTKSLALRWGTWLVRVSYKEGTKVAEDSAEISRIVGSAAPPGLAGISKRVRVLFHADESREYTNQAIYVMQFLRNIPGIILYDEKQRELIK